MYGVYAPVYCPAGVAAFGRDTESSQAGLERAGGLPRRSALPRLLPRHRLRPAPGVHRSRTSTRRASAIYTGFKYYAITHAQAARQVGLRPGRGARQAPGSTRRTSSATARSRSRRWPRDMDRPPLVVAPTTPSCSATGGSRARMFLDDLFRQLHFDRTTRRDHHARASTSIATRPTRWRRRACRLGRQGLQRVVVNETNAWIYRHLHEAGRAHGRAGAPLPERQRPRAPRAQPGRARAPAGPIERLGIHHEDRHDGVLCDPPHQRAHRPVHPPLRGPARAPASTSRSLSRSSRRTTSSPTSTIASTRLESRRCSGECSPTGRSGPLHVSMAAGRRQRARTVQTRAGSVCPGGRLGTGPRGLKI